MEKNKTDAQNKQRKFIILNFVDSVKIVEKLNILNTKSLIT